MFDKLSLFAVNWFKQLPQWQQESTVRHREPG